jgi:hypothetical protein
LKIEQVEEIALASQKRGAQDGARHLKKATAYFARESK